jgi:putative mRNA 3-end processing factor
LLIEFTDKGLFCSAGNFYIDPWLPVDKAVITHAHSDHARPGNKYYLCHRLTKPLLQARLGDNVYETLEWDETINMNGVIVSLHPAGHIIGSSQIRIEYKGEVWVVSGDYKIEDDRISGVFEPIRCNTFITESTFGLPVYDWKPQNEIYEKIKQWVYKNKSLHQTSVLIAYSLGKAQRLMQPLSEIDETVYLHGAVWNMHTALISAGVVLPHAERITPETPLEKLKGAIVIAPSSAEGSSWMKKFTPYETGVCSGWMQVRGNVRRRNADAGFILSDHADWKGLLFAIKATNAQKVFITHGFQAVLSRYLNENGIEAREVKTQFGEEETKEKIFTETS